MNDINDTCEVLKKYIKKLFQSYNAEQIRQYCREYCRRNSCNGECFFAYDYACARGCDFIDVIIDIKKDRYKLNSAIIGDDDLLKRIESFIKLVSNSKRFTNIESEYYKIKDNNVRDLFTSKTFGVNSFYRALDNILKEK